MRAQLKVKDDKISEVMEELAGINALYDEAKHELDEVRICQNACCIGASDLSLATG